MTDNSDSATRNTYLMVTGALLLLCVGGITIISRWFPYGPDHSQGPVEWFLAVYAAAWIVYLVALWRLGRLQGRAVSIIFVFAIAMRLLLLLSNPILEDDFYRYIWDGHVVLAGLSPFATAPEYIDIENVEPDPDKRAAAMLVYENINFPWVKTIYPPAAQVVFAAEALIFGWLPSGFKYMCFAIELLVLWLMWRVVHALKLAPATILIYAWNPLLLKEINNSHHIDIVCTLLLTLFVLALIRQRGYIAMLMLMLAAFVKLTPVLLVPLLLAYLWRTGKRMQAGWNGLICVCLGVIGAALCYVGTETDPFSGLKTFADGWEMNAALFPLGRALLESAGAAPGAAAGMAKLILFGGLCLFILYGVRKVRDLPSLWRWCAWTLVILFLISPVGNPWYLVWLLPFLLVTRNPIVVALMFVTILYYLSLVMADRNASDQVYYGIASIEYGLFLWFLVRYLISVCKKSRVPETG